MRVCIGLLACTLLLACQSANKLPSSSQQWIPISQGLPSHVPVLALAPDESGEVFAATYDRVGVYKSGARWGDWIPDNNGLPSTPSFSLLISPKKLWAGTAAGLYFRLLDSQHWQKEEAIPTVAIYATVTSSDGTFYAGTDGQGIYASVDGGTSWKRLPGMENEIILSVLAIDAQTILAGTSGEGLFITHDAAQSWERVPEFENAFVPLLKGDPRDHKIIYASTRRSLMRSRDGGESWESLDGGIETQQVYALLVSPNGKHFFAGTASNGIYESQDDGESWKPAFPTEPEGTAIMTPVPEGHAVLSLEDAGGVLVAGTTDGVFRSSDEGVTWSPQDYRMVTGIGAPQLHDLALNPRDGGLFAATDDGLYVRANGVWERYGAEAGEPAVLAVAVAPSDPDIVYAGTSHKGVYRSADAGKTWTAAGGDLGGRASVVGILVDPRDPQTVFARVLFERIYKSADTGDNWHTVWTGMSRVTEVETFAVDPTDSTIMYAGGNDQLFSSHDRGETWIGGGLPGVSTLSLLIDPRASSRILAGTTDGVYSTEDGGKKWTRAGLTKTTVTALALEPGGAVLAGTKFDGVYASSDWGKTFTRVGAGLDQSGVIALVVDGPRGVLYAATTGGVYCFVISSGSANQGGRAQCR